jgi:preprotein translocase subunit SecA
MSLYQKIRSWFRERFARNERFVHSLQPIVDRISELEPSMQALSDEQLREKTVEFRARLDEEETLDDILPEAFAAVREASVRSLGMRHYDVQMVGGIVLHQGKISEMKTGEGKTLVATLPMYLNAILGKGVHLITVNDYLARRDAEWMGNIFKFLGMTVGIIQHDMQNADRKNAYGSDITYGTNNEFGFDYLRDNLKSDIELCVQRGHNFAIVDEVDSILIDEARTPLIISGEVERDSHNYNEFRDPVESLVRRQRKLVSELVDKALEIEDDSEEVRQKYFLLLGAEAGDPKNKRLLKFVANNKDAKKMMQKLQGELSLAKELWRLKEGLLFAYSDKENSIELTDLGQDELEKMVGDVFILPVIQDAEAEIDADEELSDSERAELKTEVYDEYAEKSEKLHNINQLLKSFTLFEKDVEYVLHEGEVVIVDEFTGRMMPGRRWSDGLHQAVEAKERVTIAKASQTVATVTLQNYFRMYETLSGMTGTALTEANEFSTTYKLDVISIPTHQPMVRNDFQDVIYKTQDAKYHAVADEVMAAYKNNQPVLVGTVSVEVSERLSKMLSRKGVKHNVLNAKQHQREADIIAQAGRPGAVTIATNMAGRGTDILLGGNPENMAGLQFENIEEASDQEKKAAYEKAKIVCDEGRKDVLEAGGLYIVGTERHESRRVDNQLRGRAGRQGDPGTSRFFLSLEDDLMRIFGSDRIAKIMERFGIEEEDAVIESKLVSRAIENAQKKVEENNFQIRKKLIEYDDVNNKQREIVYGIRRQILEATRLRERVSETADMVAESIVDEGIPEKTRFEEWDLRSVRSEMGRFSIFGIFGHSKLVNPLTGEDEQKIRNLMIEVFRFRRDELLGSNLFASRAADYLSLLMGESFIQIAEELQLTEPEMVEINEEIQPAVREQITQEFDKYLDKLAEHSLEKLDLEIYLKLLFRSQYDRKSEDIHLATDDHTYFEKNIVGRSMLQIYDKNWMEQLDAMDHVKDGVHLAGYGGRDPVIEYKREGFAIFQDMIDRSNAEILERLLTLRIRHRSQTKAEKQTEMVKRYTEKKQEMTGTEATAAQLAATAAARPVGMRRLQESHGSKSGDKTPVKRNEPKVGRNDPCPCGSGKKYKKCHGA